MSAAEIREVANRLRTARVRTMKKSGNQARRELLAAASSATGGDRIYSGEPRGALNVTARVTGGLHTSLLTIKPTAKTAGQWAWANTGTAPGARRHRSGRRRGTIMHHPGTSGRGAWDDTAEKIKRDVVRDLTRAVEASI